MLTCFLVFLSVGWLRGVFGLFGLVWFGSFRLFCFVDVWVGVGIGGVGGGGVRVCFCFAVVCSFMVFIPFCCCERPPPPPLLPHCICQKRFQIYFKTQKYKTALIYPRIFRHLAPPNKSNFGNMLPGRLPDSRSKTKSKHRMTHVPDHV